MDIYASLTFTIKVIFALFVVQIVYFIYKSVVRPWYVRRQYSAYPKVSMTDKFHPMLGDIKIALERVEKKQYLFGYMEDEVDKNHNLTSGWLNMVNRCCYM